MNEILITMFAGLVLVVLTVFVLGRMTKGFLFTWLIVKLSGEKKVLVEVLGATRSYFVAGVPAEGEMTYKDASKEKKRASVDPSKFIFRFGVHSAYIDEEKNAIIDFRDSFKGVQPYDNSKADRLVSRIISAKMDDRLKQMIIIGLVLAVFLAGISAYFSFDASNTASIVPAIVESVKVVCNPAVI